MSYRTVWVSQWVTYNRDEVQPCPQIDAVLNDLEREGWNLHTIVPGTNAQTYSGVFITVQRA